MEHGYPQFHFHIGPRVEPANYVTTRSIEHLKLLSPNVNIPNAEKLLDNSEIAIKRLSQRPVLELLSSLANPAEGKIEQIGETEQREEGILFQWTDRPGNQEPYLIKLFNRSALSFDATLPVLSRMGHLPRTRTNNLMTMIFPTSPADRIAKNLHGGILPKSGHSLASAEITLRVMAHVFKPDQFAKPVAIVNDNREPVGFMVPLARQIVDTTSIYGQDSVFDRFVDEHWTDTSGSPQILHLLHELDNANIHVWDDPKHPDAALLFDARGALASFGSLRYEI